MLKFLCLGYSSIVQRRVLPAIRNISHIVELAVASQSRQIALQDNESDTMNYDDYLTALREFSPDIVYVSLINVDHAYWTRKSLEAGAHVIVDKPAFQTLNEAVELVELSKSCGLLLAEALVYTVHPQIELIKRCFYDLESSINHISALFTFPTLDPSNFRYSSSLGGGALMDLGSYAVSIGREFFGSRPTDINCSISKQSDKFEVETAFTMMATYPKGRTITGHFNFNGEYTNQLITIGEGVFVNVERVFTIPAELENVIHYRCNNISGEVIVPRADTFRTFVEQFICAVLSNDCESYSAKLLADADVRNQLILCSTG